MKRQLIRVFAVAVLVSGAGLLTISGLVGGWRWTFANVASGVSATILAPKRFADWTLGTVKAHQEFEPDHPRLFADRFAGALLGLGDYTAPAPISGCGVSFWRVRETDPRGVVIIRDSIGLDGKLHCERVDFYTAVAPVGLPEWADEVSCLREDGTALRFAAKVDRLHDTSPWGWMKHYNRTVVLLLERQDQHEERPRSDT